MKPAAPPGEFGAFRNEYIDAIAGDYMRPVYDDALTLLRPGPREVLDVGCGNGVFGRYFKDAAGARLTGVDASAYALEKARAAGYDATVSCPDFSSAPLGVPEGAYDLALCKDVLEHLLDPAALLGRIRSSLKPGGRLLCLVPNHFTLFGRLKFLFTGDMDTYGFFPGAEEWEFPHVRFFTKPGFLKLLARSGFALERDYGTFFFHRVPLVWRAPGYRALMRAADSRWPTAVETAFVGLFRAGGA